MLKYIRPGRETDISTSSVHIQPKIADLFPLKNLHLAALQISDSNELFITQSLTPEYDKL